MKHIAIIGSFNCHLECIAFLLESFKEDRVTIYITSNSDNYGFLDYYKSLYKFTILYNFSSQIPHTHNAVFKLTSSDKCVDHEKIISILHFNEPEQLITKSRRFLSLTPYVKGPNIHYTFPVYSPVIHKTYNKIVTMVGYYTLECFDEDTIMFINKNKQYIFNFILWGSDDYSRLQSLENVKLYRSLEATAMMNIIHDSKYILSKKYINYDRFSGQLGLAVSYEKPLILDVKTKTAYNLPGITFTNQYSEIGNLDTIDVDQYERIQHDIRILKQELLQKNKSTLHSFLEPLRSESSVIYKHILTNRRTY